MKVLRLFCSFFLLENVSAQSQPSTEAVLTQRRNVVLVHGFLESGARLSKLKNFLEARGHHCLVPKLTPRDGKGGIDLLAKQLQHDIDARFGTQAKINLIGFSMGGIVSRQYLQRHGGKKRCEQLFTISSPHRGTLTAYCYPTIGAQDMRFGSQLLKNLESNENYAGKMPVTSFYTPLDLMILPSSSSIWSQAEVVKHWSLGHPFMIRSSWVMNEIAKRLERHPATL